MNDFFCELDSKEFLNEDTAYLTFYCPEIAEAATPGQFVNVSCSKFLRRPFGIAGVNKEEGTFRIGVKTIGEGTFEIASFEEGEGTFVLGPLGHGFEFDKNGKYILVSGGTGVFPVNFAYEYLTEIGANVKVVQGFRDKSQVIMNKPEFVLTTDAGDAGIKGNCCDGLNSLSEEDIKDATVICVGPIPMMKAVASWAKERNLVCYVSMEQRMACGIGICLVCVCKTKAEEQGIPFEHKRCCKEGPVFNAEEVIW